MLAGERLVTFLKFSSPFLGLRALADSASQGVAQ
jgi:hypothetical protein